jgi:hypothetical protein
MGMRLLCVLTPDHLGSGRKILRAHNGGDARTWRKSAYAFALHHVLSHVEADQPWPRYRANRSFVPTQASEPGLRNVHSPRTPLRRGR